MIKNNYFSFLNKIFQEYRSHKHYIAYALFLSLYVYLPQILGVGSIRQGVLWLISIMILWLISKVNKLLFSVFAFITLFISAIGIHIYYHWGDLRLSSRLEVALLSPHEETMEYLQTYINWVDIIAILYFIIGSYLLYFLFKKRNNFLKIVKVSSLVLLLIIFSTLSLLINPVERITPFNLISIVEEANKWQSLIGQRKKFLQQRKHKYNLSELPYDKIVIIIGESANRYHMSVYGYNRKTTPFLDSLKNRGVGFYFNNIFSPANSTRYAIPLELTSAKVEHFFDFLVSESIITVLNDIGYKTYWISNQSMVGEHDTYITSIANEANITQILNAFYTDQKSEKSVPDEILLKYLDKFKPESSKKQAFFFHLMGSHAMYERRCPENRRFIKSPQNMIDNYDNSVYYTDFVLSQIYERFKKANTLFIYISDHGEYFGKVRHGHGSLKGYKDEFNIPFIAISSSFNPRLSSLYELNKIKSINMESFYDIVLYLLGLKEELEEINNTKVITVSPSDIVNYTDLK
ncbi:integral membrane protein [Hydrogenimonas sp.]|nr:integral membrane protein [Hydrogenimonas sp.]